MQSNKLQVNFNQARIFVLTAVGGWVVDVLKGRGVCVERRGGVGSVKPRKNAAVARKRLDTAAADTSTMVLTQSTMPWEFN